MKSISYDPSANTSNPMVVVIDSDPDVRKQLTDLFESVSLPVKTFGSAGEFFSANLIQSVNCLIVDVRLPGLGGLDLQTALAEAQIDIPIIFVTGYGDIRMAVKAVKAGAVDFLTKPIREQDLLDAVNVAFDRNSNRRASDNRERESEKRAHNLRLKFDELRPREKEVMILMTAGLLNREIALKLRISPYTVKIYRNNIMQKFGANSLVQLVRIADTLKLHIVPAAGLASALVSTRTSDD